MYSGSYSTKLELALDMIKLIKTIKADGWLNFFRRLCRSLFRF